MAADKSIYFVRHGETEYNRKGIVQGSGVDSPLNTTGQAQADAFFAHYKDVPFEVVLTSALQRTHQTMKAFIELGLQWEQWSEINEINWGIHEGKPSEPWMIEAYQKMTAQWKIGNLDACLQEGESARELQQRTSRFLAHLQTRPETTILVCTHGRTLRCLLCQLKGQPLSYMEQYKHHNTGVFKAHLENGAFRVVLENDTTHLQHQK